MNNKEQEISVAKKKNRKTLIVGIIAIIVIFALVAVFIYVSGSKDRKLKETLHLAEKYLNELDYEKAIAAYEDAINIDPKCVDAYIGIADIYVAMADESESNNDYETAIKDCDSGLEILNRALNSEINDSETITAKIDDITTKRVEFQKKLDEYLVEEQKKLEEENKLKKENEKKERFLCNDSDLSKINIGDIVHFGHNDDLSLTWKVLDIQDDRALLFAESTLKSEKGNYDSYFYDEELSIILEIEIEDTINNVPKGYSGETNVNKENRKLAKNAGLFGEDNQNPDVVATTIEKKDLCKSVVDNEKIYFFFLSYDEAKQYNINDTKLRNSICTSCVTYYKPTSSCSSEFINEWKNNYDYDSTYGYKVYDDETTLSAAIDSEGNLCIFEDEQERPAMWVKIN